MRYGKNIVLFSLFAVNLVDQPSPEVVIEQGSLSGKISADGSFFEYLGIPYATTNSATRFKAPLPPPKWNGVYRAVDEMHSCLQYSEHLGVIGSEDCLKANVHVPVMAKKPLPVMVYIHGGAFVSSSGGKMFYGPEFLLKHDVIVVTFNYRLGPLGFICLGIEEAPGNAALKDQIAALRWVKKNIAAFGGDPDNVTLFGESAGGACVALLLASEVTTGLFHRAIVQSGSVTSTWAINRKPLWIASLLAKALGHNTEDPHEIYKVLSKLSYKELMTLKANKPLGMYFDTLLLYVPCVEKPIPGVEAALTDIPYNLLENKPKNIPVIYGSNSREGLFLTNGDNFMVPAAKERNKGHLFTSDLDFDSEAEAIVTAKQVKEFYFGNKTINKKTNLQLEKLYTELYFEIPAIIDTDVILENSNATVFNYYFNYSGNRYYLKDKNSSRHEAGACHGDDVFYLFDARLIPFRLNEKDGRIVKWMTRMWTNFAKYGHPTPSFTEDIPVNWTASSKNNHKFLYIEEELRMGPLPHPDSYNLWKGIYNKHRRQDINYYSPN